MGKTHLPVPVMMDPSWPVLGKPPPPPLAMKEASRSGSDSFLVETPVCSFWLLVHPYPFSCPATSEVPFGCLHWIVQLVIAFSFRHTFWSLRIALGMK